MRRTNTGLVATSSGSTALAEVIAARGGYPTLATSVREGYVDVKDYGAVGNGTTDDTVAIATAVATGNNVYIGPNLVCVVQGISVTTIGQMIFGGGTLKLKAGSTSGMKILTLAASKQVVDGITFDGGSQANTWNLQLLTGCVGQVIRNNLFLNNGTGAIDINGTNSDLLIEGNRFIHSIGYGVLTEAASTPERVSIANNVFIGGSNGDAIEINTPTGGALDISCTGNLISGYTTGIGIGFDHVTGGVIANNTITDCGLNGVHMEDGTTEVTVSGNRFLRIGSSGIVIGSSTARTSGYVTISGNYLSFCSISGDRRALLVEGSYPVEHVIIANNIVSNVGFTGGTSVGINVDNAIDVTICNNLISRVIGDYPYTCAISVYNLTNGLISGNRCEDGGTASLDIGIWVRSDMTNVSIVNNNLISVYYGKINESGIGVATNYYKSNNQGVTPVAVTGSRVANPALASLLTTLAAMGLITDSTT